MVVHTLRRLFIYKEESVGKGLVVQLYIISGNSIYIIRGCREGSSCTCSQRTIMGTMTKANRLNWTDYIFQSSTTNLSQKVG